jgi:hypothetical protein
MTLNEIADRNYAATLRRKKITEQTSYSEMIGHGQIELNELKYSHILSNGTGFDPLEAVDVALVMITMLKKAGYDVQAMFETKVKFNEIRHECK